MFLSDTMQDIKKGHYKSKGDYVMNMDFNKFYDYLTEANDGMAQGQTFATLTSGYTSGGSWFYIPKQTDGKDFGDGGKGKGDVKVLVRTKSDSWDAYLLRRTSTAATNAIPQADMDAAKARLSKTRDWIDKTGGKKVQATESMGMDKLLALSESYFNGNMNTEQVLNEGEGEAIDNGDTSVIDDPSWTAYASKTGMSFEDVLKVCVGLVTGTPVKGGDPALITALKSAPKA